MKLAADERPWLDPVRGHNFHLLFGKFRSRLSGKPSLIRCHYANSDHPVPEILIGVRIPCSGGERRVLLLSASLADGIPVSLRNPGSPQQASTSEKSV